MSAEFVCNSWHSMLLFLHRAPHTSSPCRCKATNCQEKKINLNSWNYFTAVFQTDQISSWQLSKQLPMAPQNLAKMAASAEASQSLLSDEAEKLPLESWGMKGRKKSKPPFFFPSKFKFNHFMGKGRTFLCGCKEYTCIQAEGEHLHVEGATLFPCTNNCFKCLRCCLQL